MGLQHGLHDSSALSKRSHELGTTYMIGVGSGNLVECQSVDGRFAVAAVLSYERP